MVTRRANIKDVARRAGVSPSTVSNALNHPERVRPDRLAIIEQAMHELHYLRSEPARHLRSGRSRAIGLLLLDADNPGFMQMAEGVEDAVDDLGWAVMMGNSRRDPGRESRYLRTFSEQQAAGLIVTPGDTLDSELVRIRNRGTPVVLMDRAETDANTYSVSVHDRHGGRLAAQHLIDHGHRHICFIGSTDSARTVLDRFHGVQDAVTSATPSVRLDRIRADLTMGGGREAGRRLIRWPDRPTAVIAAVDVVAFGVLQSFTEARISVPREISLCGYDDTEFTSQLATPLTTVRRPHYNLGKSAGTMLLSLLDGTEPDQAHVRFEPELVVRNSTGPAF